MPVTALYASLLALLLIILSLRVIRARGAERVSLGSGNSVRLERRIRAHANFAEYVPLSLILIGLLEFFGTSSIILHGLGLLILAGRILHGYALSFTDGNMLARVSGMALTLAAIAIGALLNLGWLFFM